MAAARQIPVEDFCRDWFIHAVTISPDGTYVGFLKSEADENSLYFLNLATQKTSHVKHIIAGAGTKMNSYRWIGDRRVSYTAIYDDYYLNVSAMDVDGGRWVGLAGMGEVSLLAPVRGVYNSFRDDWFMTTHAKRSSVGALYADVVSVNHLTGDVKEVLKNPGEWVRWWADAQGDIRMGASIAGTERIYHYRSSGTADWRVLGPTEPKERRWEFLAFDDRGQLWVATKESDGYWGVGTLDPATGQTTTLFHPEGADAVTPSHLEGIGFELEQSLVQSPRTREMLGIHYTTTKPAVHWFSKKFAEAQSRIDAALPDTVNRISSFSHDEKLLLVTSTSDRDVGAYSVYDREKNVLQPIARSAEWLRPEEMAPMYPTEFTARDGLRLQGYLTLPLGRPRKNLPLIVMPHGGPFLVRDIWRFDRIVQFLANRGYAVLQVNFRGSSGSGWALAEKGAREIGRGMQNDITDAVQQTIASGLADPKRVAIMGSSFGGYSTVFALGETPDLYRCGIAMLAPVDWRPLIKSAKKSDASITYDYWSQQLFDPELNGKDLEEISALRRVPQIKVPLLTVYNTRDPIVPFDQAIDLRNAMRKHKKKHEQLSFQNEGHSVNREANRRKLYLTIEDFLKRHMPAD